MGDKKKREKKKGKKKDERKKEKKDKYSSSEDSDDDDNSDSDSSRSRSREKKSKKSKDKVDKKKLRKQKQKQPEPAPQMEGPYNFSSTVTPTFPTVIPGLKGMLQTMPPPAPSVISTAIVPKPKSKEVNIFKLLPKLNYGPVLFAKLLYSTDFIEQKVYQQILKDMVNNLDKTIKEQNHKKGGGTLQKCISQLEKLNLEHNEEPMKKEASLIEQRKENRYQQLEKVFSQSMKL